MLLKTAKSAVLEMSFRIEVESCGYKRPLKSALLVQGKSPTYTLVTFLERLGHVPIKKSPASGSVPVNIVGSCFVVQLVFAFGLAGLLWPDKFMPVFEILMFPWAASHRAIRANGIVAIGLSLVLLVALLMGRS